MLVACVHLNLISYFASPPLRCTSLSCACHSHAWLHALLLLAVSLSPAHSAHPLCIPLSRQVKIPLCSSCSRSLSRACVVYVRASPVSCKHTCLSAFIPRSLSVIYTSRSFSLAFNICSFVIVAQTLSVCEHLPFSLSPCLVRLDSYMRPASLRLHPHSESASCCPGFASSASSFIPLPAVPRVIPLQVSLSVHLRAHVFDMPSTC